MLGLKRGCVELHPHDQNWGIEAAKTIAGLEAILGDIIRGAEHVGSTSIPDISAKPIIDIALATDSFSDIIDRADMLKKNGFYYRKDASDEKQLLIACGPFYDGNGDEQTHFIHVVLTNSDEWWSYIYFRDYLRLFKDVALQYQRIKFDLMHSTSNRSEYTEGKDEFISSVRTRAKILALLGKGVTVKIDRPKGSQHPGHKDTIYPINYGFIEGTHSGDGEPLDAYILGVDEPLISYTGKVIGIVHRKDDIEDKLLVAPNSFTTTVEQAMKEIAFTEQYFDSTIYLI